jgi:hypothetical protein
MTTITPVTPPSHAQTAVTEAEAAIRERLAALEATAKTDVSDISTWFKTNWPHFVTWASSGLVVLKVFGKL